MAVTIPSFVPTQAFDTVGIYTQNFRQLFPQARPVKATVKEEAKMMEHPIETGATTTDHRIIMPVEIEFSMILQAAYYKNTYQAIRQVYFDATLLVVQTKTGVYDNQIIASLPHEEDPAMYDAITIALKLKQVLFATAQFGIVPANPANTSTTSRGAQSGSSSSAQDTTRSSLLYELFK